MPGNDPRLTILKLEKGTEFSQLYSNSSDKPENCTKDGKFIRSCTGEFEVIKFWYTKGARFASPTLYRCERKKGCDTFVFFDSDKLNNLGQINHDVVARVARTISSSTLVERGQDPIGVLNIIIILGLLAFASALFWLLSFVLKNRFHKKRSNSGRYGRDRNRKDSVVVPQHRETTNSSSAYREPAVSSQEFAQLKKEIQSLKISQSQIKDSLTDLGAKFADLQGRLISPPRVTDPTPAPPPPAPPPPVQPLVYQQPANHPPVLSPEILRNAVATNNYSLISSYPHWFITETQESRQGIGETQFSIDGTHESAQHSANFARSEFILISLTGQYVLIPNIVQGATDPARSLRRIAENKRIYVQANGSSGYMIKKFATVNPNVGNSERCFLLSVGILN